MKLPETPVMKILVEKRKDRPGHRVATHDETPSVTQQQFKDQCDVNKIIEKYQATGEIHHLARESGAYADLSNIPDYQTALNTVIRAEQTFDMLPAAIRERFKNDPSELLTFIQDPKNKEEGIKLGLFNEPPPVTTTPPPITPTPTAKTKQTNEPPPDTTI